MVITVCMLLLQSLSRLPAVNPCSRSSRCESRLSHLTNRKQKFELLFPPVSALIHATNKKDSLFFALIFQSLFFLLLLYHQSMNVPTDDCFVFLAISLPQVRGKQKPILDMRRGWTGLFFSTQSDGKRGPTWEAVTQRDKEEERKGNETWYGMACLRDIIREHKSHLVSRDAISST